ncbi:MAG: acyl-CoA dehydrogenase family protein [Thermodesulfobacteriota bacterium]
MDLSYTAEEERFREELRAFLERAVPRDEPPDDLDAEFEWLRDFQRRMHAGGWVGIHWPRAYGGRDATPMQQAIFAEELARARAPQLVNRVAINNVGPTLMHFGTDEQKRRYLPGILSAEEIWCQLYSEPGAGSDLAALRTRAVLDGDDYVVTGQKVWTSYAQHSRWAILLARTGEDAVKQRGISYLIVDMRSPGIEIRPLRQLTGASEFNEVFLDAVRVPRANLIGQANEGWRIAQVTLAHERGTNYAIKEQVLARINVDELIAAARSVGRSADASVRQRLAQLWLETEIMRFMNLEMLTRLGRGVTPGAETSIVKTFWADLSQAIGDAGVELLGERALLLRGSAHAAGAGRFAQHLLFSRAATIAGGTSEIQRNIIAQRLLGLPRG